MAVAISRSMSAMTAARVTCATTLGTPVARLVVTRMARLAGLRRHPPVRASEMRSLQPPRDMLGGTSLLGLIVAMLLFAGCAGAAATSSSPRPPIVLSGSGDQRTAPIALAGDYAVAWTAVAGSVDGCANVANLESVAAGGAFDPLVNDWYHDGATHSGSTNLYHLAPASYYLSIHSGCAWSFTLTPRG